MASKVQVSIEASLTVEMDASEWKSRLADMAEEDNPEAAALAQVAQEVEGVEVDTPCSTGRAWVAVVTGDGLLV